MEVRVRYSQSERNFKESFSKFDVTVRHAPYGEQVSVSFQQKEFSNALADFDMSVENAKKFAYAILAASASVQQAIVFEVDEYAPTPTV
jgi:hypothetical protein